MEHDRQNVDVCLCKHCGYPLHGLGHSKCPECGSSFDLTDPSTYLEPKSNVLPFSIPSVFFVLLTATYGPAILLLGQGYGLEWFMVPWAIFWELANENEKFAPIILAAAFAILLTLSIVCSFLRWRALPFALLLLLGWGALNAHFFHSLRTK